MLGGPLFRKVVALLNPRKNRILSYAQMAMTEHQFIAFKRMFLDELGERGLESELKPLLTEKQHGMDGHGRE